MGRVGKRGAVVLVLAGGALRCDAAWEETRKTLVDPMNAAFHRELPRRIRQRDLAGILGLYAVEQGTGLRWENAELINGAFDEEVQRWHGPAGAESIRSRYERILDLFQNVESAEVRINNVDWEHHNGDGYPAQIHLVVRGEAGGVRRQLDQQAAVRFVQRDGAWKIAAEDITARQLASGSKPRFTQATQAAGIDNVHDTDGSPPFRIIGGSFNNSGSAVGDVDGDGYEDVVLASASHLALYHNNGDGTFADVTKRSGIPDPYPSVATGVVLFDYDN